jgi:hypothetical protein
MCHHISVEVYKRKLSLERKCGKRERVDKNGTLSAPIGAK